ncbi:MAG: acyl carrier protein [Anaerolineales bacterium]|jgi:acyl carrier protein
MTHENDQLTGQVQTLLAEVFEVPAEQVTSALEFGDLPQWDSLGHMDLMMRLEERFGVEISTDTIAELVSVPAICDYIQTSNHKG